MIAPMAFLLEFRSALASLDALFQAVKNSLRNASTVFVCVSGFGLPSILATDGAFLIFSPKKALISLTASSLAVSSAFSYQSDFCKLSMAPCYRH
jgi:small basic protein